MAFGLGWKAGLEKIYAGDDKKLAEAKEVTSWFSSIPMLVNHARSIWEVATPEERACMPNHPGPPTDFLIWSFREATQSPDPVQRAGWVMYQPRDKMRRDYLAEKVAVPVIALPVLRIPAAPVEQEISASATQEDTGVKSNEKKRKRALKQIPEGGVRRSLRLSKLRKED